MYGIYANIRGILMVNVTIYNIHGSYGYTYMYIYITIQDHNLIHPSKRQHWTAGHLPFARAAPALLRWAQRAIADQELPSKYGFNAGFNGTYPPANKHRYGKRMNMYHLEMFFAHKNHPLMTFHGC